jgi:hypothetical protein
VRLNDKVNPAPLNRQVCWTKMPRRIEASGGRRKYETTPHMICFPYLFLMNILRRQHISVILSAKQLKMVGRLCKLPLCSPTSGMLYLQHFSWIVYKVPLALFMCQTPLDLHEAFFSHSLSSCHSFEPAFIRFTHSLFPTPRPGIIIHNEVLSD